MWLRRDRDNGNPLRAKPFNAEDCLIAKYLVKNRLLDAFRRRITRGRPHPRTVVL
jgi:hypothetical protein